MDIAWGRISKPTSARHLKRVAKDAVLDIAIVYVSYGAAFFIRAIATPLDLVTAVVFTTFAALLTFTSLYLMGVYRRIWSRTSGHEIKIIFYAAVLSAGVAMLVALLLNPRPLPLSVIVVASALAFMGFAGVRYRSRLITGFAWRWDAIWHHKFPRSETRVLIIGAGESGQALAWRLKYRARNQRYRVVGFIDDDPAKLGMYVEGCRVLGTRDAIEAVVEKQQVDLIAVSIHNISGQEMRDILQHCEKTAARIKIVPNLFAIMDSTAGAELLRDVRAEDLLGRTAITRHEKVDLTPVMGKVVMITGAAGSIGAELSRQIVLYEPHTVLLVDNNESGLHDIFLELSGRYPGAHYTPILADITRDEPLRAAFNQFRPQVVFHAAAYKHVPILESFPGPGIQTNIEGTRRLVELARHFEVERFVLVSSDKAVNPSSIMGATKRLCELMLHAYAQQSGSTLLTSVRFGNVLGSRGSVVPIFERQIDNGGPITVTHPDMTRYFMSIPEAVNLVIHAACLTQGDDIFFLRMGEVVRIVDLAERMIRMRGLRPYRDIEIAFTGIRPGEKMHEELTEVGEVPSETVHPHIFLLKSWSEQFNAQSFLERLSELPVVDHNDYEAAWREISQLIGMNYEPAIAAD